MSRVILSHFNLGLIFLITLEFGIKDNYVNFSMMIATTSSGTIMIFLK